MNAVVADDEDDSKLCPPPALLCLLFLLYDFLRGQGVLLDGLRVPQLVLVELLDAGVELYVLCLRFDGFGIG